MAQRRERGIGGFRRWRRRSSLGRHRPLPRVDAEVRGMESVSWHSAGGASIAGQPVPAHRAGTRLIGAEGALKTQ